MSEASGFRAIRARSAASIPLVAALTVSAVAFAVLLSYGWRYYDLPWDARFDSDLHHRLRSSGSLGQLYGNIGIVLILGNLLYLVRRRLVNVPWLGSMKAWMDWHVFSGIVGPAFIVLHSTFTLRTWPAIVSSASLAIVVVTGLFGRYLYRLVPRVADGRIEPHEEVAGEVDHALMQLHAQQPGGPQVAALVEDEVEAVVAKVGTARTGFGAIASSLGALWQLRELRPEARATALAAGASIEAATDLARAAAAIGRLIARYDLFEQLARAASFWRGLHRNLVIVMLIAASLHIAIAAYLGFGL